MNKHPKYGAVYKKTPYTWRLAYMYSAMQREERRGADFSGTEEFLNELRDLIDEHQQARLPKVQSRIRVRQVA